MSVPRRKSKVSHPPLAQCPLRTCMLLIGGAWTPNIIWYLAENPRRFSELMEDIDGISPKVLTTRLRKMEEEGIVLREVRPTSPPTVEYSLSALGRELRPAIEAIVSVGQRLRLKKPVPLSRHGSSS